MTGAAVLKRPRTRVLGAASAAHSAVLPARPQAPEKKRSFSSLSDAWFACAARDYRKTHDLPLNSPLQGLNFSQLYDSYYAAHSALIKWASSQGRASFNLHAAETHAFVAQVVSDKKFGNHVLSGFEEARLHFRTLDEVAPVRD